MRSLLVLPLVIALLAASCVGMWRRKVASMGASAAHPAVVASSKESFGFAALRTRSGRCGTTLGALKVVWDRSHRLKALLSWSRPIKMCWNCSATSLGGRVAPSKRRLGGSSPR